MTLYMNKYIYILRPGEIAQAIEHVFWKYENTSAIMKPNLRDKSSMCKPNLEVMVKGTTQRLTGNLEW